MGADPDRALGLFERAITVGDRRAREAGEKKNAPHQGGEWIFMAGCTRLELATSDVTERTSDTIGFLSSPLKP